MERQTANTFTQMQADKATAERAQHPKRKARKNRAPKTHGKNKR